MKQRIITISLMAVLAISVHAQLEVNQNGYVAISASNPLFGSKLSVGDVGTPNPYHNIGVHVNSTVVDGRRNVAIIGETRGNSSLTTGSNYGVVGIAQVNPNHGRNFGVCGAVDWSSA